MSRSGVPLLNFPLYMLLLLLHRSVSQSMGIEALHEFKELLKDPMNSLQSWVEGRSPCRFAGVTCDPVSSEVIRVSVMNMSLSGAISPSIFWLPRLITLELGQNAISGVVPPEIANCSGLQILNLSSNALKGELPNLSSLRGLRVLDLSANGFSGDFPSWVGELPGLVELGFAANNFNEAAIPGSLET